MRRWAALIYLSLVSPFFGQSNHGELQLRVTDPSGIGVQASVQLESEANQYRTTLKTNAQGYIDVQRLPYGIYRVEILQPEFAPIAESITIRGSLPLTRTLRLRVASVTQSVEVKADSTLIDPEQAGSVNEIGADQIENRLGSIPGRSLQDLINSQPGWLYEGNAVLHPRGSEYQTQFVVDGIPLTDNRSPSFGPEIEADDVDSISIYTAGIPAEYGRKMGGVVEVNTLQDVQQGFHGEVVLAGGSFDTASGFARGQDTWGANTLGASVSGSRTDHYLNPVVLQNFSNTGTLADFSGHFERVLTPNDRIGLIVRHELSRYDIPNEQVQQAAGQRQTADNIETMGVAFYQHGLSSRTALEVRGMVRDNANDFNSNPESTPIEVFQNNRFREGYMKADLTTAQARHEFKFGVETDNTFLHENFSYLITDPTRFDDDTPLTFAFAGQRPDLEQSAFAQDHMHFGKWTVDAGLRWDHYQLLLNKQAFDPRVSVARYFAGVGLVAHVSYDRVFQTPSFENILLSSSAAVDSLDASFLRLPVEPSQGNYYEAGISKALAGKVKLDANYFRRDVGNDADDDQIDNTTISFPIAFRKSVIYGAEGKLEVPDWHKFSGFISYSYEVGNVWFPVTGGLFLGDNAAAAKTQLNGHFPDSQDQRNTLRGRARYRVVPRFWFAGGMQYDTGLPFEFDGDPDTVLAEYGQQVLNRINFNRGRIYPSFQVNASAGADVYKSDRLNMQLQADGQNLNNVLDVIDFGGLFSGNAIGPPRSYSLRLTTTF